MNLFFTPSRELAERFAAHQNPESGTRLDFNSKHMPKLGSPIDVSELQVTLVERVLGCLGTMSRRSAARGEEEMCILKSGKFVLDVANHLKKSFYLESATNADELLADLATELIDDLSRSGGNFNNWITVRDDALFVKV